MAIEVKFYSYQGKPNVAVKSLGNVVATKNLNFVTDSKPELTFDIECSDKVEANYCTWVVNNKTQYWFIDSREAYENIYIYHLSFDVLATLYDDYMDEPFLIERCTNLLGAPIHDSKWLVPSSYSGGKHTTGSLNDVFSNTIKQPMSNFLNCLWAAPRKFDEVAFISSIGEVCPQNAGAYSIYAVNIETSAQIAGYLLSNDFNSNVCKIFEGDPSQALISITMLPFSVSNSNVTCSLSSGLVTMIFGNATVRTPDASATIGGRVLYSNIEIDCGYLSVPTYFNDFRDYPPFTKVSVFLPFVGMYEIDHRPYLTGTNRMYIKYFIDVASCTCVVGLYNSNHTLVDSINGTIGIRVPVTSSQSFQVFRNNINTMINLGSSLYSGLAGLSNYSQTTKSDTSQMQEESVLYKKTSPNPKKEVHKFKDNNINETTFTSYEGYGRIAAARGLASAATGMEMGIPYNVKNISGSNSLGRLGDTPYLYIQKVDNFLDSKQSEIVGRLCMQEKAISSPDVKGFVKLADQQIPMYGMRLEVYKALYDILTTGFYKTNTWS